jgi:hypothetical protein
MSSKYIAFGTVLFFSLLIGSSFSAFAATCSVADVSSSQDCIGKVAGNDSETWFNTYGGSGAFNINQWVFAEKIENDSSGPVRETEIDVGLQITPPVDGEALSGTWFLNSTVFDDYLKVALVFKAGQGFSAYLLDGTATSGTWDIRGWTRNGLSHASVYVVSAVPVPAAVWLFGSGLVGLIGFSWRKRI